MPISEVILTESIRGLGAEADIVKVKRGFARNYLLPTGKAYEVTPVTLRRINQLKTKRAEREAKERNEAEEIARRINKLTLNLTLETGATGKAFGSITVKDLEEALKKELPNVTIERHSVQLEKPIKETGLHEVPVRLHADVTAKLKVNVKSLTEPAPAPAEAAAAAPSADADAAKRPAAKLLGKKKA
jgi:large subunit ribosomal protein L9